MKSNESLYATGHSRLAKDGATSGSAIVEMHSVSQRTHPCGGGRHRVTRQLLLAAIAGLSWSAAARADMFLYEPFEAAPDAAAVGWASESAWKFTNRNDGVASAWKRIDEGLSFDRLVTSDGGAIRIHTPNGGNCAVERQIDIAQPRSGESLWMSWLLHYTGPSDSGTWCEHEFGIRFRRNRDDADESSYRDYPFYAGTWDQNIRIGTDGNGKDWPGATDWIQPPVSGESYLVLCAVTNIALGAWNGSRATEIRSWVLDVDHFQQLLGLEILDSRIELPQEEFMACLDTNCVAVAGEKNYGDWGTANFNPDDFLQITARISKTDATYVVDEIRMGNVYRDVLPLTKLIRGTVLYVK